MTTPRHTPLLLLIIALLAMQTATMPAVAQDDDVVYRNEFGVVAGVSSMLDDTNRRLFGSNGLTGGALLRFVLNPRSAVKVLATYNNAKGDTGTDYDNFYPVTIDVPSPDKARYTYSGGIVDVSATYELHFLPYGYVRGYQGFRRFTPYIQAGLGFTYSLIGKAFTPNIPIGFGFKWKASRRVNISLDWAMHFTPNDNLDGIAAPTGIKSEMFRAKDHYAQTLLTLTYDISPKCPTCNRD